MIVKVDKSEFSQEKREYIVTEKYDLDIPDQKIIDTITVKNPSYWYALIDGQLFKSDYDKGLKSIFFKDKSKLETAIKNGLYWKRKLIPGIGGGIGYDVNDFYKKLKESHKIEFKEIKF